MDEGVLGVMIPILAIMCGMLAIIGKVFVKPWIQLKERQMEINSQMVAEKAAQYAAHTDRLEARVQVLERIITDGGRDLAMEIEQLRTAPQPDRLTSKQV
jgi:ABC-type phosphate transport system auxiliary subunit